MSEVLELWGQAASPGLARGPAHLVLPAEQWLAPLALKPQQEREALKQALSDAVADLRELAGMSDMESAAILEFQIEMLIDPMMIEPVLQRIDAGVGAAGAWVAALDDYIEGFDAADDEHVRARAADLLDMKNRVLAALTGDGQIGFPAGAVFVGPDIAPSLFLAHDWSQGGGIVLFNGSTASHVAMLARSRAVPMVVGTGPVSISGGTDILVDGAEGRVSVGLQAAATNGQDAAGFSIPVEEAAGRLSSTTMDGVPISILANINDPSELSRLRPDDVDGIGLLRTEFLMATRADLVNEERQVKVYRNALIWAKGKPVTIRLLDFGGDKPRPGSPAGESGSGLGLRGIRLLLAEPDLLRIQARALLRAAPAGNLRVLVPMVTIPAEIAETRAIFIEEAAALCARGVEIAMPPIGMMVEVPAAALMLDLFDAADFFSFGTNDLAQYLGAAARDNSAVSRIHDAVTPAVLRTLELAVASVSATGKSIGICGDMAGEPSRLPALLGAGLREFSMAPSRMPAIRARLAHLTADGAAGEG
jgi:phosphotransferase system enzyme I (PtsI)